MRVSGAPPSSHTVLSTSVTIADGKAYTVAGMGPESGLRLQVINDTLVTPAGKSLVRVIQASLKQQTVKFHCSCGGDIAAKASFASVSPYAPIPPGTWTMSPTGSSSSARLPPTLPPAPPHPQPPPAAPPPPPLPTPQPPTP